MAFSAPAASAARLELVAVGLLGPRSDAVDVNAGKVKFPVVDGGQIAFVELPAPASERGGRVFGFSLAALHNSGRHWYVEPTAVIAEEAAARSFGRTQRNSIVALFRGPSALAQRPTDDTYQLSIIGRSDGKVVDRDRPRDVLVDGTGHYRAGARGLKRNDASIFDCYGISDFDATAVDGNREFLFGFYGRDNRAEIDLWPNHQLANCDKGASVRIAGFLPAYSKNGAFFSSVELKHEAGNKVWQLAVSAVDRAAKEHQVTTVLKVDDVAVYDITSDAFKYLQSYGWSAADGRQVLYFQRAGGVRNRQLSRTVCEARSCAAPEALPIAEHYCIPDAARHAPDHANGEEHFRAEFHRKWQTGVVWAPVGTCDKLPAERRIEVEIGGIEWAVPYVVGGETFVAAQVVVRTKARSASDPPWLSRIALMRVIER